MVLYERRNAIPEEVVAPWAFVAANIGVGLTAQLLAMANLVGWSFEPNGVVYEMVLFAILVHITVTFIGLAIMRPDQGG